MLVWVYRLNLDKKLSIYFRLFWMHWFWMLNLGGSRFDQQIQTHKKAKHNWECCKYSKRIDPYYNQQKIWENKVNQETKRVFYHLIMTIYCFVFFSLMNKSMCNEAIDGISCCKQLVSRCMLQSIYIRQ